MSEKDTSQILISHDTLPTDKPCYVAAFQEKAFSVATQKKNACQEENLKLCAIKRHRRLNNQNALKQAHVWQAACTPCAYKWWTPYSFNVYSSTYMYLYMCVQCTYIDDHNAAKVSRKTAPFGGLGINSGLQPHILKLICDLLDRRDEKLLMPDARTVVGSGKR